MLREDGVDAWTSRRSPIARRRGWLVAALCVGAFLVLAPGLAPATVEEQRARLPPAPAERCVDDVQGTWRSHAYYPRQGQWSVFTLHIRREGSDLTGDMEVRFWDGPPDRAEPVPCRPGHDDWTLDEPARGTIAGMRVEFGGSSYSVRELGCGPGPQGYILDTFIGTIDPALQEFQSVNRYPMNGEMVEDVNVFRRIACLTTTGTTSSTGPTVVPSIETRPTTSPVRRASGCNCRRPGA